MSIKDIQTTDLNNDVVIANYKENRKKPLQPRANSLQDKVYGDVLMLVDVDLDSDEFKQTGKVQIYPEKIAREIILDFDKITSNNDRNQVKTAIRKVAENYIKSKGLSTEPNEKKNPYMTVINQTVIKSIDTEPKDTETLDTALEPTQEDQANKDEQDKPVKKGRVAK